MVFGQVEPPNVEKHIFLKNEAKEITSLSIDKLDRVKVWLKGVEKPINGHLEYLNDSTFTLNDEPVAMNEIDQIKVKKTGGRLFGSMIITAGGAMMGGGTLVMSEAGNMEGFASIANFLLGFGITVVGLPVAAVGLVVLTASAKKYNLDIWTFQFENKKG